MEMLDKYTVANILYRVPLKYIREIKNVCKQWHAIISDPHLFKLYHHQTNNGVHDSEILAMRFSPYALQMSSLDFENKDTFDVSDVKFPHASTFAVMIGSCNGLACLRVDDTFVFWNPCTNQYRTSPKQPNGFHHLLYSFGYDSVHDDYKVVWFTSIFRLNIYSLKSNTCTSLDGHMFNHRNHRYPGIYLNGSLHYEHPHSPEQLLAFSLAEEKIGNTVPNPDGFHVNVLGKFSVLDECLCLCREDGTAFKIWVMKEYMVKDSWSKLCTVLKNQLNLFHDSVNPLCTSQDGNILIIGLGHSKIVKYNMKRNTTCTTIPHDTLFKYMFHVMSWVSPSYNEGHEIARSGRILNE